jgi:hypothetical protein
MRAVAAAAKAWFGLASRWGWHRVGIQQLIVWLTHGVCMVRMLARNDLNEALPSVCIGSESGVCWQLQHLAALSGRMLGRLQPRGMVYNGMTAGHTAKAKCQQVTSVQGQYYMYSKLCTACAVSDARAFRLNASNTPPHTRLPVNLYVQEAGPPLQDRNSTRHTNRKHCCLL